jgi:hypothetical protein
MFTTNNWTHSNYNCADKKALISIGADLKANFLYFVSILDTENKEIDQSEFEELGKAVQFINSKYGHWLYTDLEAALDSGGCSSCEAH